MNAQKSCSETPSRLASRAITSASSSALVHLPSSWLNLFVCEQIERVSDRRARATLGIAQQCLAQNVKRHPELQRDAGENGGILGASIGMRIRAMVTHEDFAEPSIVEP